MSIQQRLRSTRVLLKLSIPLAQALHHYSIEPWYTDGDQGWG